MKAKLNRRSIDAIAKPTKGYSLVWDSEQTNFGVRVTAAGARSYFVQRRVGGTERRITLARTDVLSAEEARRQARKVLGQIATGVDPVAERAKAVKACVTLDDAFDAFLADRERLKPLTVTDIKRAMADLGWQKKRINALTYAMVRSRHQELGKASHARANLTMRYLRAILNFASAHYAADDGTPFLPFNPVAGLTATQSWYSVKRRQTLIAEADLKPWMSAVLSLDNAAIRDYLILVLLTGLRRSESLQLAWRDVNLRDRTLTIPDPKNGEPHTLPLSDYLVELMKRRHGDAAGEQVFDSERGALWNLRYAIATVEKNSGVSFCIHDLRRTFATVAERLDTPAYALKQLMNHKNKADVTQGYIIRDVERLRRPMQRITDYFLAAAGIRAGADVVALPSGKRAAERPQTAKAEAAASS